MAKRGLGKGLDALFTDNYKNNEVTQPSATPVQENKPGEQIVKIALVVPNANQPRKHFDKAALAELTESVKQYGILAPLIVTKKGSMYEIIAGERRWRAAQAAGLTEVPVVVRDYDKQQSSEIAIIENLQREDLNPIEEANAYEQLMKDFGLSQEEVAQKVSKNRTTITNTLRLLKLDKKVQKYVIEGTLSGGHARALLSLEDGAAQAELAEKIISESLSVRETESLVKKYGKTAKQPKTSKSNSDERDYSVFYREYEKTLEQKLGTKVRVSCKDKNKGKIEIDYYSQEDFERIVNALNR